MMTKPFNGVKRIRPNAAEKEYEQDAFRIDVSGDLIFIWGGGMEGCVSRRVMKGFVKWMKEKKVI